jgi:hypothetical protein
LNVEAEWIAARTEAELEVAAWPEFLVEKQGARTRRGSFRVDAWKHEFVGFDGPEAPG